MAAADSRAVRDFLGDRAAPLICDAVAALLRTGAGPLRCSITRTKLKPRSRLTVSSVVDGPGLAPTPLTAIWGEVPTRLISTEQDASSWLPGPFKALYSSGDDTAVFISPFDPSFPSLASLHDRRHLTELLRGQGVEVDEEEVSVVPVRYRPGQRHVLRMDLREGRRIYAKCYRDDTGAHAATSRDTVEDVLTRWGGPAAAVQAIGYVPSERVMLWAGSTGAPLGDVLAVSPAPVRTAGTALRAIHDSTVDAPHVLAAPGPAGEAEATLRSCEHVVALLPREGDDLVAMVGAALHRLDELPPETGHLLHGDYKCDNLLVEDDRLRLLDLDRVRVGDPALDLGKMTADLRWWAAGAGRAADDLIAAFLDGYGPVDEQRLLRAACYEIFFILRSVGRRIPLHEPAWAERVEHMVALARSGGGSP